MLILDGLCSDYGIVHMVKIVKNVFQMIQIIGPILAIISLAIIFFRLMSVSYDYDSDKKYEKDKARIKNCIIALLVTFFLPLLVNLVMGATFMANTFEISACWKEADLVTLGNAEYINNDGANDDSDDNRTGTFIINPNEYHGINGNPNESIVGNDDNNGGAAGKTELLNACEEQAKWMKNYEYSYEKNPTVEKSKTKGTCVTYVACVLQRIGALKPGKVIWHTGKGYGTGKVYGTTSSMTTKYMDNKPLSALKSELQAGDIILVDDNKSGDEGSGGHIFIFAGEWKSNGNPLIYDNFSADNVRKGKSAKHEYSKSRKVLAIVRLS